MKKLVILLTVVAFVSMAAISFAADKGPAQMKFEAKMGTVSFDHAKHQERTDCATCHHSGEYKACDSCHDGTAAPKAKDAFHKNCKDCHKEKQQGPTKCKECHVK